MSEGVQPYGIMRNPAAFGLNVRTEVVSSEGSWPKFNVQGAPDDAISGACSRYCNCSPFKPASMCRGENVITYKSHQILAADGGKSHVKESRSPDVAQFPRKYEGALLLNAVVSGNMTSRSANITVFMKPISGR